ncbi:MAG: hypothetical protein KDN19_06180 [Verrucomicrobiae bacterium]|nr:hypothetical protein [Verrucomicrobiae bacterium]
MENETPPSSSSAVSGRRQFFASGARVLAVGGMASFAAFQEWKRRQLCDDPNCIRLNTCSDCVELGAGCQKEKAKEFRASNGQ